MADIDIGKISEALNNKVDLPSVAISQDYIDFVVEQQKPTEANGYTWYRKYKSGWVEQGGQIVRGVITFAIPMADINYNVSGAQIRSGSTNGTYYSAYKFVNMRETGIDLDNGQSENPLIAWSVSGYAA